MRTRHGSQVLAAWRLSQGHDEAFVQEYSKEYDPAWPQGLGDLWDTVIIDESHCLKNENSEIHLALQWLNADFHVFLSATPLVSGADWAGNLRLTEPKENLWSAEILERFGVTTTVNPYFLPDNYAAVCLRFTMRAATKYIFAPTIAPEMARDLFRTVYTV